MNAFKKGTKVKFKIGITDGFVRGKGVVIKLVPKGAMAGAARLTVKGDDGRIWRPYPVQCTAV